jgi:NAD(P)-dependent dehydrogenase (short-subunit alcohol dehydrogenase family)
MTGNMQGKVCVITGATSGIGLETARRLAAMGARIVMVGRDRGRGEAALKSLSGEGRHSVHYADLSLIAEMKRVAAKIAAAEPRIDVLMNNAGAAFHPREVTADGIEKTFALNHLSYFVLSNLLGPYLRAAAPSRIINVASRAHERVPLDLDDLMFTRNYNGMVAYGKSKLCNILFTRELARRLGGTGVTANALHPGFIKTRIGDSVGGIYALIFKVMKQLQGLPLEKGADTPFYLASSPDVANITGEYFSDCRVKTPSAAARDDAAAKRLWEESARLTAVG